MSIPSIFAVALRRLTAGPDQMTGESVADAVDGGDGNDRLEGEQGNDTLSGGGGNDLVDGGQGDDLLAGGPGDDTLVGGAGFDIVSYEGASGGVRVDLGQTKLQATGGDGRDRIFGVEGLIGTGLGDRLTGNAFANLLVGGAGNDTLSGGAGNDTLFGGAGNDVLDGGIGLDTADYSDVTGNLTISLSSTRGQNTGAAGVDQLRGIERLVGGAGNDRLAGSKASDTLEGGLGDDWLDGGAGRDTLEGGAGDDTYVVDRADDVIVELAQGGVDTVRSSVSLSLAPWLENLLLLESRSAIAATGNDAGNVLTGNASNNTLSGLAGDDTLDGAGGNDTLNGGTGSDTADYSAARTALRIDLNMSGAQNMGALGLDTLVSIENLIGGSAGDVLLGDAADNRLDGGAGADRLEGGEGDDILLGGAGNDTLSGGTGADSIAGGEGTDTVVFAERLDDVVVTWSEASATYAIETASGTDLVTGVEVFDFAGTRLNAVDLQSLRLGAGDDSYAARPEGERVLGQAGNDTLEGDAGADELDGGEDDDSLSGGDGNDTLAGGAGNDTLSGDAGADILLGGAGDDSLTGGEGNDTLTGDAGNDILQAGLGDDVVDGGAGTDMLVIDATYGDGVTIQRQDGDWIINLPDGGRTVARNIESLYFGSDRTTDRLPVLASLSVNTSSLPEGDSGTTDVVVTVTLDRPAPAALTLGFAVTPDDAGNGIDAADFGGADLPTGTVTIESGATSAEFTVTVQGDAVSEQAEIFRIALGTLPAGVLAASEGVTVTIIDDEARQLTAGADRFTGTAAGDKVDGAEGNDQLRGLDGDDVLSGGAGNDHVDGGSGNDTLAGGAGDDTLIGGSGFDTVTYATAAAGVTVSLDTTKAQNTVAEGRDRLLGVEALIGSSHDDSLTGSLIANLLIGGDGNDVLDGGRGNDTLFGGNGNDSLLGGAGLNTLEGGAGNDTYTVEDSRDVIVEQAGGGTDSVIAWVDFVLADQVEILTLQGLREISGTGNAHANMIRGNERANTLRGMDGDDRLEGAGGNDLLQGGQGNDTLLGDAGLDRLHGDDGNDVLLGLLDNDTLEGGAGNDTLDGGAGRDRLVGGAGDDILIVDNAYDVVVEEAGGGIDTVRAQIAWTLGDHVENLVLTDVSAVSGTGNALDNILTGSAGGNVLRGLAGNDTLDGAEGNDILDGGAGDDVLVGGAGVDTASYADSVAGVRVSLAISSAQDTVGAGNDSLTGIESLIGSAHDDSLTGDGGTNRLTGGAGSDSIDGGAGADILTGGLGNDTFVFAGGDSGAATASSGNVLTFGNGLDVITDFSAVSLSDSDVFKIDNDEFGFGSFVTGPEDSGIKAVGNAVIVDGKFTSQIPGDADLDLWYVSGVWNDENKTFEDSAAGPDYIVFRGDLTDGLAAVGVEAVLLDNPLFS